MKRLLVLSLVLAGSVALGAHAQGFSGEETTLNGTIQLAAGELPMLRVGGEDFTLRINRRLASEIEVTHGASVGVTGYLQEQRSADLLSLEKWVLVRSIEINGTRYVSAGPSDHRRSMHHQNPTFDRNDRRSGREQGPRGGRR